MMLRSLLVLVGLASNPGFASEDSLDSEFIHSRRFGLGLALSNSTVSPPYPQLPIGMANFRFIAKVSERFRMEPEFGYYRHKKESATNDQAGNIIRAGLSLVYNTMKEMAEFYGGARFLVAQQNGLIPDGFLADTGKVSKTDLVAGPLIGAEYFFSDNFSIGGEVQFNFIWVGRPEENQSDETIVSNQNLIVFRWYI